MNRIFTLSLLLVFLFSACQNPLKYLDKNKPERAYKISMRQIDNRLSRGKIIEMDQTLALQESYSILQNRLINRIEHLENSAQADRWLATYPIYSALLNRRKEIDPYLYLLPSLQPSYEIAALEALTERSRLNAGNYCFGQSENEFPAARAGEKTAARSAYHWLERSLEYAPENTSYQTLRSEMYDLSTVRILLTAKDAYYFDSQRALESILQSRQRVSNRDWVEVYYERPANLRLDYQAVIVMDDVYVSRNIEHSSSVCYSKEVIDRYKTVEKEVSRGDTTITVKEKVPVKITVRGTITEVEQYKEASGALHLYLEPVAATNAPKDWYIRRGVDWSNDFSICSGDRRALPHNCSGSCWSYPSDWSMLSDLGGSFRSSILSSLCAAFPERKRNNSRRRS